MAGAAATSARTLPERPRRGRVATLFRKFITEIADINYETSSRTVATAKLRSKTSWNVAYTTLARQSCGTVASVQNGWLRRSAVTRIGSDSGISFTWVITRGTGLYVRNFGRPAERLGPIALSPRDGELETRCGFHGEIAVAQRTLALIRVFVSMNDVLGLANEWMDVSSWPRSYFRHLSASAVSRKRDWLLSSASTRVPSLLSAFMLMRPRRCFFDSAPRGSPNPTVTVKGTEYQPNAISLSNRWIGRIFPYGSAYGLSRSFVIVESREIAELLGGLEFFKYRLFIYSEYLLAH